jgi:outer membrane scaffolding protein for murein synthesis (MipA/OmpV family)
VVADFALDGVLPSGAWTFSAGPRLTLASGDYMDAYFSVSPLESVLNGAPAYAAGGGVKSVGAAVAATYRFSPQWSTTGFARYDRLVGSAGDSPIPQLYGSRNQFTFGANVAYSFAVGGLGF